MSVYRDQMNQSISLNDVPKRIVSLVPSQTELLYHLGMEDEVIGITKFCIHPQQWFESKERVGGTKSVDFEKVKALTPDLIIGNKEENTKEDIEGLKALAPVWMSDIYSLSDALEMIQSLGNLLDKQVEVERLLSEIQSEFLSLREYVNNHELIGKSVAYFIWHDPGFLAGKNTFIDAMLSECGFVNASNEERYPEGDDEALQPDYVFLSSEPYPFKEKHLETYQEKFPNSKVVLVDGEMFSWYGSRLKEAPAYFRKLVERLVENP